MDQPFTTSSLAVFPHADGSRVPFKVYSSDAIYALEQERIYRGPTWNFLGLEAEIPKPGDYKSTFIGDTPVVMTRAEDGTLAAWVNRCAHRGAVVCRLPRGNALSHSCVYHQWNFGTKGNLQGVPFRRGQANATGMPKDFDPKQHNLRQLAGGQLPWPGVRHLQRHRRRSALLYRSGDAALCRSHLLQTGGLSWLHAAILRQQLEALSGEREGPVPRQPAASVPYDVQHPAGGHAGEMHPGRNAWVAQHHLCREEPGSGQCGGLQDAADPVL